MIKWWSRDGKGALKLRSSSLGWRRWHRLRKLRVVFGHRRLRKGLLEIGNDALQLLQAAILLLNLATQSLDFVVEVIAILIGILEVPVGRILVSALETTSGREGVGANALQLAGAFPWQINKDGSCRALISVHVTTAQVLSKILLAREPVAGAAVAVGIRTHQRLLRVIVLLMNFALVAQETTRVGEALNLITTRFVAFVWTIVFIHMFTRSDELV
jgi:hypothetical protein